jgi:hypothetical protein
MDEGAQRIQTASTADRQHVPRIPEIPTSAFVPLYLPAGRPLERAMQLELFNEVIHNQKLALSLIADPRCLALGISYFTYPELSLPIPPMHMAPRAQRLPDGWTWAADAPIDHGWHCPHDEVEARVPFGGVQGRDVAMPAVNKFAGPVRIEYNDYPFRHLPWDWENAERARGRRFRDWFAPRAAQALKRECVEIHIWLHPWKVVVRRDGETSVCVL